MNLINNNWTSTICDHLSCLPFYTQIPPLRLTLMSTHGDSLVCFSHYHQCDPLWPMWNRLRWSHPIPWILSLILLSNVKYCVGPEDWLWFSYSLIYPLRLITIEKFAKYCCPYVFVPILPPWVLSKARSILLCSPTAVSNSAPEVNGFHFSGRTPVHFKGQRLFLGGLIQFLEWFP